MINFLRRSVYHAELIIYQRAMVARFNQFETKDKRAQESRGTGRSVASNFCDAAAIVLQQKGIPLRTPRQQRNPQDVGLGRISTVGVFVP